MYNIVLQNNKPFSDFHLKTLSSSTKERRFVFKNAINAVKSSKCTYYNTGSCKLKLCCYLKVVSWPSMLNLFQISDISNDVWNSISEALLIVLSRYQDLKSQSYVKEFVKVLVVSKPEACLTNLTPILMEYINTFLHLNISLV